MYIKCLEECLAHIKHYGSVRYYYYLSVSSHYVIFFLEVSRLLLTTRLRGMHLCIPYTDEENEAQKNVMYQVYTGKRDEYHNLMYPYYVPLIS